MIKRLLFSILVMGMSFQASASHLLGGELWTNTINTLGTQELEVWLVLYRDGQGAALPSSETVTFKNNLGATVSMSIQRISTTTLPVPTGLASNYTIEMNVYYGKMTLPSGISDYTVSYSNCCRPMGISNMTNSGSESFYITSSGDISNGLNSNAYSTLPLAVYTQVGVATSISHQHIDLDGDSLHYIYDAPLNQANTPVAGYTLPAGSTSGPFTLDSITGLVTWTPLQQGLYGYRFTVEEYRMDTVSMTYNKVGEKNRDMVFVVAASPPGGGSSLSVSIGGSSGTLPNGVPYTQMKQGMMNSVTLTVNNIDSSSFSAKFYGEPMELDSANVNVIVSPAQQGSGIGVVEIQWTPSSSLVRSEPYYGTVRITVGGFTYDVLLGFEVLSTAGIGERGIVDVKVFPNPVVDDRIIVTHPSGIKTWALVDLQGRVVTQGVGTGSDREEIVLQDLSRGVYLLKVEDRQGGNHVQRITY